jgi:transposase
LRAAIPRPSAAGVFGEGKPDALPLIDVKELHAKIGQLALDSDSLSGALGRGIAARNL